MNGIVTNGWGFVIAAYAISAVMLAAYVFNVIAALRRTLRDQHTEG